MRPELHVQREWRDFVISTRGRIGSLDDRLNAASAHARYGAYFGAGPELLRPVPGGEKPWLWLVTAAFMRDRRDPFEAMVFEAYGGVAIWTLGMVRFVRFEGEGETIVSALRHPPDLLIGVGTRLRIDRAHRRRSRSGRPHRGSAATTRHEELAADRTEVQCAPCVSTATRKK